jgi:hypothetical protein
MAFLFLANVGRNLEGNLFTRLNISDRALIPICSYEGKKIAARPTRFELKGG